MQDEISAARRKKRRKVQFRRFLFFTLALVVVVISVFIIDSVTKTTFLDIGDFFTTAFKGGGRYPTSLGDQAPIQSKRMAMSYAVLTNSELLTYSSSGAQLMAVKHGYVHPCMDATDNRILLYNAGSRDISVYNRSKHIASFQTEYAIINAKVSGDGTLAILTESERYTCQLEIYRNGEYDKLLTWYGSSGFPLGTYIKEDGGTVTVARITQNSGAIYSILTSIDLSKNVENYEIEVAGVALAAYYDGENLIVVTDAAAYRLDKDGAVQQTFAFPDIPVLYVTRDKNSNIAVAFGDNNQFAVNYIVVLSKSVSEHSTIDECGMVTGMYFSGNRLFVLGNRIVAEYDVNGKLKRRYQTDFDTQAVFDLNGIVVIMPDRAERLTTPIKEEDN